MPFTCELSGEVVSGTDAEIVATPSGHVCLKRLLLEKLSENGGVDPFDNSGRPLSPDQLIALKGAAKDMVPTPRPTVSSMPNLLQMIQSEYDALVLELFDTRKALEETRQELSQALYQNDAAVRVIARLSTERDTARQELQQWQASAQAAPAPTAAKTPASESADEPDAKRRKVDEPEVPTTVSQNSLPQHDLNLMMETWKTLSSGRKASLKAAAATAPGPDVLAQYAKTDSQSWHKTTCKGLNSVATCGDLIATCGKDKQVILYSTEEKVIKYSWQFGTVPTCLDVSKSLVVASDKGGKVLVFSVADGSIVGEVSIPKVHVVGVKIHPSGKHVCLTTAEGSIVVARLTDQALALVSEFKGENGDVHYSCGAVHPDGLLFAAGTTSGHVHLWDFKNNVLASVLKADDVEGDEVTSIAFSSNGYHLATGHKSASTKFWDLRKQRTIGTLNEDKTLSSIDAIAFDTSGKYAAVGGDGGLLITTVKEWGKTATIAAKKGITDLVWTSTGLASCSNKERPVTFYGSSA